MPCYNDGNYIEVTHTKHLPNNDCFYMSPSNEKYFRENREIFKGCEVHPYNRNTYNNLKNRIKNSSINRLIIIPSDFFESKDIFKIYNLRSNIKKQISQISSDDRRIYNDDIDDFELLLDRYCAFIFDGGQHDIYSTETIIKALSKKRDKKKKYDVIGGTINCFIWVFDSEYRIIDNYYKEKEYNSAYNSFVEALFLLDFDNIYIGKYNFNEQKYEMAELYHFNMSDKSLQKVLTSN